MTNDEAKKFRERAVASARRYGFAQAADDIAQTVLLKFCEGRGQHQTIDQAVIDVIRSEYGRPGSPGYERRFRAEHQMAGMEATRGIGVEPKHGIDFERLVGSLPAAERIIARLTHEWGFTGKEIGDLFGLTESRISQRVSGMEARLYTRLAAEEQRVATQVLPRAYAQAAIRPEAARRRPPTLEEILSGLPDKGPCLEREAPRPVAEIEPWQMALTYEEGFCEWLT